ncbi:hypothetical protein ACSVIJ_07220 [Pseudomonas sp. NCHU5208]|uniref:hypothetical protein n=1 Tax=unclassified Pseudomonas TaxID=196821 RepID=UPI003F9B9B8D
MTNAVKAKPQTTDENFLAIPHRLLKAPGFVCRKKGTKFDLNLTQLVIFQYMKDFYESCKRVGNPYHESQRSIAKACRVSRDIVIKAMKLFEQHGYLIKEPKREGCKWVLPYALEVVSEDVQEHAENTPTSPVQAFSSESNADGAPTPKNASNELIEGNSKDILSIDIEEKPTPAVVNSAITKPNKLVFNKKQEESSPQHPAPTVMPSHLQEDIPDGYYDEHCRREYDYLGMEIDERYGF